MTIGSPLCPSPVDRPTSFSFVGEVTDLKGNDGGSMILFILLIFANNSGLY